MLSYSTPNTVYQVGTIVSTSRMDLECIVEGTCSSGLCSLDLNDGDTFTDGTVQFKVVSKGTNWESLYPIGSVFISVSPISPEELFKGSKWQALDQGRVLIGAGGDYAAGSKGGKAQVQLTVDQMPSHTHTGSVSNDGAHGHTADVGGAHGHDINTTQNITVIVPSTNGRGIYHSADTGSYTGKDIGGIITSIRRSGEHTHTISNSGAHQHDLRVNSMGGSTPVDIMQPWFAVYMWYRVE